MNSEKKTPQEELLEEIKNSQQAETDENPAEETVAEDSSAQAEVAEESPEQ